MEAVAPQWQVFGVAKFLPGQAFQRPPQLFPIAAFDVGIGTWLFFRSWIVREPDAKYRSRWMICRILLSFFQAVTRRQPLSRTGISLLCKEIVAEGMG